MGQKVTTMLFGELEFDQTWVKAGGTHIGRLTKGGYCHFSGHPILSAAELQNVIPRSPALDEALEWFENRGKVTETPGKSVVIAADGEPRFEDGSPIEDAADIINYMNPGYFQEAALKWWAKKSEEKEKLAAHPNATKVGGAVGSAEAVLAELGEDAPTEA